MKPKNTISSGIYFHLVYLLTSNQIPSPVWGGNHRYTVISCYWVQFMKVYSTRNMMLFAPKRAWNLLHIIRWSSHSPDIIDMFTHELCDFLRRHVWYNTYRELACHFTRDNSLLTRLIERTLDAYTNVSMWGSIITHKICQKISIQCLRHN